MGVGHLKIYLAAIAFGICTFSGSVPAQAASTICLQDGSQISAERFEVRDSKFILYVPGSATPLEYESSAVKGVNVPCTKDETPQSDQFAIHGSNTIGERLMPMLIEAYAKKYFDTKPVIRLPGSEEREIVIKSTTGAQIEISVFAHGSGTATPALLDGKAIIGMSSRRFNDDEQKKIAERFNTDIRAPGNEHVLALDGLAVIVNSANPVKRLSLDQIAQIFSGEITNWRDVGGDDMPITLYRRDNKSGTFDTFKALVLAPAGGTKRDVSPQAKAIESSEALTNEVEHDPQGIGFIGLPYIGRNTALAITSSCGIASRPSRFSIKAEEYPLARRLYLYTIGAPADATAHSLLDFVLSDEAQPTVREAEFVDQAIDFQDDAEQRDWGEDLTGDPGRTLAADKPVPRGTLSLFNRMLGQTHRTTVAFRFEKGSAQLDNRALQDVARLARYLAAPEQRGKHYVIAGFADSEGSWASNVRLSSDRASAVVAQLQKALQRSGIRVPRDAVIPFSYMAPVACNDSDAGAAKNRRVEFWIER